MTQLIIRRAEPEDAPLFMDYWKQVGSESDNLTFGAEGFPLSAEEQADNLRRMNASGQGVTFIAIRDGHILGDCNLTRMPRRMHHRATLGLAVVKECWNQGIGSRLLEQVIDYAKQEGIELITLEVRVDNRRAIHLYCKYGFMNFGTFPAYTKVRGKAVDFDMMALRL